MKYFMILLVLVLASCDQKVTPPPVQAGNLSNDTISVQRADAHLALAGKDEHVIISRMLLAPIPNDLVEAQRYINELYQHDQATGQVASTYKYQIDQMHNWWFGPKFHRVRDWIIGIFSSLVAILIILHFVTGGASTHLVIDALRWLLRDHRAVVNLTA